MDMPRSTRRPLAFLSRMFLVAVAGWLLCLAMIFAWSMRSSDGNADAIVVLGAAQYSGRPSPVLKARLDQALSLWKAERAPLMVFTGGQRTGDVISEAAAGRRFAMRQGMPANAILLEATGRTSLESVHGAAILIKQHHDSLQGAPQSAPHRAPRVLLVSDPFHMLRVDILARMHGLTPLLAPTRTSPISANRSKALEYMIRESFALPADVAKLLWLYLTGHSNHVVAEG